MSPATRSDEAIDGPCLLGANTSSKEEEGDRKKTLTSANADSAKSIPEELSEPFGSIDDFEPKPLNPRGG